MVRQLKFPRKFGVGPEKRKALLRKLATSLFSHERIQTTLAKAKELQPFVENIIVDCRKGRNIKFSKVAPSPSSLPENDKNKVLTSQSIKDRYDSLFGVDNYSTVGDDGMLGLGYTRLWRAGRRAGDQSPIAVIELVSNSSDMKSVFDSYSKQKVPLKNNFKQPLRLLLGNDPKTLEGKRLDVKLKEDLSRWNFLANPSYTVEKKEGKIPFLRKFPKLT